MRNVESSNIVFMQQRIKHILSETILLRQQLLEDEVLIAHIKRIAKICIIALKADKKILFCGNGGSAADAQHLAAELSGRYYIDRDPLFAEALHVNTSYITAVANDYSYDDIYARLVKAKMRQGDILFGLSTSGNSENIIRAMEQAREQQAVTIGMTGATGGKMTTVSDFLIKVPSADTPRIQEIHITIGHIVCELVEAAIFGKLEGRGWKSEGRRQAK